MPSLRSIWGFQAASRDGVGPGLRLEKQKQTDLSSQGSVLWDVTSTRVRGHAAGWSGACQ